MARTCPSCGTSNENESARFCGSCGTKLPDASGEVATVLERVGPVTPPAPVPQAPAGQAEAVEFTAMCPSCGAANPPDSAICDYCGEEIPVEQRRRRTAVFGALGAAGGAGVAGGALSGQGGGGALSGMAGSGEALSGLGQQGGALSGLGQTPQAMSGLGNAPGGALPGMGTPGNLGVPPPPGGGAGSAMGGAGSPGTGGSGIGSAGSGSPPPLPGADAAAVAPPPVPTPTAPPPAPPSPPPAISQPSPPPIPAGSGPAGALPGGGANVGGIIIKTVVTTIGVIGAAAIGAVVLGGILVFTGDPATCVDRTSTPSSAALTELYAKWNQFQVEAQAGPAVVSFNETEATSRAQQYLDEKDIPLDDVQVYFCPSGRGQVKGRVAALGTDINILLEGSVDATQDPPVIVVDEIKAGNLPSSVAKTIVGERLDQNDVKTLNFGVPISAVTFTDGVVTLESPGP